MPITLDQANLGEDASDVSSSTLVLTTIAAAASGSTIVLGFMWAGDYDVSSISGGGLTWTIHPHDAPGVGGPGNHMMAIATAYAASGLASSTAVTITFGGAVAQKQVVGSSFLGVENPTVREDDGLGFDSNPAADNPTWSVSLTTATAGALLLGFSECTIIANSTPAGSAIETHEYDFATSTNTVVLEYEVAGAAGAKTIGGQWDSAAFNGIAWNGIALKATAITLDTVLPDADVTTTGWSTAPLFSKINDASDATVIQATAS